MPFYYREIDSTSIDPAIRERAQRVLEHCKKALGLVAVEIQWVRAISKEEYDFAQAAVKLEKLLSGLGAKSEMKAPVFHREEHEFWGQHTVMGSFGNKVQVRADIPLKEIMLTIAHELHHFRTSELYRPPLTKAELDTWEREAEDFARKQVHFPEC